MICLRCGRVLKNKASIQKGYGPGCAKKMKLEDQKDIAENVDLIEEIEGQIFIDEIRKCS